MFVQVIRGQVDDRDGLRRQLDRWVQELAPGATGWLGITAGVGDDGQSICFARFESADAARANSQRDEQSQWWAEAEKCYAEVPTFLDCEDVEQWGAGGSDAAGFVQFMTSKVTDRQRLAEIDQAFESVAGQVRPDVLGGLRVWTAPDESCEAVYFTSETDARAGESADLPEDLQKLFADMGSLVLDVTYLDVTDPWLYSP